MKTYKFEIRKIQKIKTFLIIKNFIFLEKYFEGAYNQQKRIKYARSKIESFIKIKDNDWQAEQTQLFLDIHFYLICWDKIKILMDRIDFLINDIKFKGIIKKYSSCLEKFRKFRNHLEHIGERIEGEIWKKPLSYSWDLGNIGGDYYSFAGEKIDISEKNIKILDNLYEDLNRWLDSFN